MTDVGAAAELERSEPHSQIWRAPRGSMRLHWSDGGALLISVSGHGVRLLVPAVVQRFEALVTRNRLQLFFDLSRMPNYDSEMRVSWTHWLLAHRAQLDRLEVVAHSKLVMMGVSVANLALGGIIKSHANSEGDFIRGVETAGLTLREY